MVPKVFNREEILDSFKTRRETWEKELHNLKARQYQRLSGVIAVVLVFLFAGAAGVTNGVSWLEGKSLAEVSPNGILLISVGWLVVASLAVALTVFLISGPAGKIGTNRLKTAALCEVKISTIPDKVLVLWQHYGWPTYEWGLVPPEEVVTRLRRAHDEGLVVMTSWPCESDHDVLFFLQSWPNSLVREMLAKSLAESPAEISEDCRQALYLAEFERARVVQAG